MCRRYRTATTTWLCALVTQPQHSRPMLTSSVLSRLYYTIVPSPAILLLIWHVSSSSYVVPSPAIDILARPDFIPPISSEAGNWNSRWNNFFSININIYPTPSNPSYRVHHMMYVTLYHPSRPMLTSPVRSSSYILYYMMYVILYHPSRPMPTSP